VSTTIHRIARLVGLVPARHGGRPQIAPAPAPVDPDATQEFRITREDWDVHSGRHPYGGA
jgi:hypothetical protein